MQEKNRKKPGSNLFRLPKFTRYGYILIIATETRKETMMSLNTQISPSLSIFSLTVCLTTVPVHE